ncbi:MAG: hypothetical protein PHC53_00220 [Patescibacteria group bacterium]|nr:hypothetical protein [Patescibacteria group bacterium]
MDIRSHQVKKILRVGVVVDGRVVAEKLYTPGSEVTIGSTPDCDFTLQDILFVKHVLFTYGPDESTLAMLPGMTYKLFITDQGLKEGKVSRSEVTKEFKVVPYFRGRVTVGSASFLLQFVDRPERPEPPKKRTLRGFIRRILFGPDADYLPTCL